MQALETSENKISQRFGGKIALNYHQKKEHIFLIHFVIFHSAEIIAMRLMFYCGYFQESVVTG